VTVIYKNQKQDSFFTSAFTRWGSSGDLTLWAPGGSYMSSIGLLPGGSYMTHVIIQNMKQSKQRL